MLTGVKWLERSSPITEKFYLMTRDDVSATQLKPNLDEQKKIDKYTNQPDFQQLDVEAKRLFWRYRHFLSNKKEVFVKFLLSVDWQKVSEREAALQLIKQWAEIDIE